MTPILSQKESFVSDRVDSAIISRLPARMPVQFDDI